MEKKTRVMKRRIILEGVDEYKKELNGIAEEIEKYRKAASMSNEVTEMLNRSMRESLELREKIMERGNEPETSRNPEESHNPEKKIDELIVTLAGKIIGDLTDERKANRGTVTEETRALAELITARSRMEW